MSHQDFLINYTYEDLLDIYMKFINEYRPDQSTRRAMHYQAIQGLRLQTLYKKPLWSNDEYAISKVKGSLVIYLRPRFSLPPFSSLRQLHYYRFRLYLKQRGYNLFNTQLPFRKALLAYLALNHPDDFLFYDAFIIGHTPARLSKVTFKHYLNNVQGYIMAWQKFEQVMRNLPQWSALVDEIRGVV